MNIDKMGEHVPSIKACCEYSTSQPQGNEGSLVTRESLVSCWQVALELLTHKSLTSCPRVAHKSLISYPRVARE